MGWLALPHVTPTSRGPKCPCIPAPIASPAPTDCHAVIHILGAPYSLPVLCSSSCCSRQGSASATRQYHLATSSWATEAFNAPGPSCSLSQSALASPAGEPLLFSCQPPWEGARRKAVWGPTVWASVASCPLSRVLTGRAQFLYVIPESSGLSPGGLSFGQRPNTQRTGLPQAYFAGCSAVHFTAFFPIIGQTSRSLNPDCEKDLHSLQEAPGPMKIRGCGSNRSQSPQAFMTTIRALVQ